MNMKKITIVALLFVVTIVASVQQMFPFPQRPIITYDLVQQVDSNQIQKFTGDILNLTCSADYPIKWIIPNNSEYQNYVNPSGRLKKQSYNPNHISLELSDLQYTDTGFYRCVSLEIDESLKANKELAATENRIHVYVSDSKPEHLFLHLTTNHINLTADELSYINCLVTDITATVGLYIDEKKVADVLHEEGFGIQVLPSERKRFFRCSSLLCSVTCKSTTMDGDKSDSLSLNISFVPSDVVLLPNNIEHEFYVNTNVNMTCKAYHDEDYDCKWTHPENIIHNQFNPSTLVINNVTRSNEGLYKCICTDTESGQKLFKDRYIIVQNKPAEDVNEEIELLLLKGPRENSVEDVEVESGKTKTLLVKVRVHVQDSVGSLSDYVDVEWRRRYSAVQSDSLIDEEINDDDTFVKVNSFENNLLGNHEIMVVGLTLKNCTTVQHSGEYILIVYLYAKPFNFKFSVNVLQSPTVKLLVTKSNSSNEINSRYLEKDMMYDVWCIAEGYPVGVLSLQFKHCDPKYCPNSTESCDSNWLDDVFNNQNDTNVIEVEKKNATFQKLYKARTKATRSGRFKCQLPANASCLQIEDTKAYIVTDVRDGQKNNGAAIDVLNFDNSIMNISYQDDVITIYQHAKTLELTCKTQLYDYDPVIWYHGDARFDTSKVVCSNFSRHNILILKDIQMDDAGKYLCVSTNKLDNKMENVERSMKLKVSPVHPTFGETNTIVLGSVSGFLGLFVVALILALTISRIKDKKKTKLLRELYRQLINSSTCQLTMDPDKPANDQIENLPYDERYEIEMNRLQLGKLLGDGEFGKVVEGFLNVPKITEPFLVAVKLPKNGMDVEHQNALISELKMMIYVGFHVNVLPLIGAVTKLMARGELYVITEHCKLGSLGCYLKDHRGNFVNELVTLTPDSVDSDGPLLESRYLTPKKIDSQSHYQGETDSRWCEEIARNRLSKAFLCTSDLLCYAYQVANGMEYLAAKNLIHRDLAVRNILLSEKLRIKISDFGLARQDEKYRIKNSDIPLPVKWMALESILVGECTVKSDVWSFGVVLWEIFSLGETPYAGMSVDEFINYLKTGNRLHPPDFVPEEIYHLMSSCWLPVPSERPTYTQSKAEIGAQFKQSCKPWYDKLMAELEDGSEKNEHDLMRKSITGTSETEGYEIPKTAPKTRTLDNRIYFHQPTSTNDEMVELKF